MRVDAGRSKVAPREWRRRVVVGIRGARSGAGTVVTFIRDAVAVDLQTAPEATIAFRADSENGILIGCERYRLRLSSDREDLRAARDAQVAVRGLEDHRVAGRDVQLRALAFLRNTYTGRSGVCVDVLTDIQAVFENMQAAKIRERNCADCDRL